MVGEIHNHLFFECEFNRQLLHKILNWIIGVRLHRLSLKQWIQWTKRAYSGSQMRTEVLYSVIAGLQHWCIIFGKLGMRPTRKQKYIGLIV